MKDLTREAQAKLDSYMEQTRRALRGTSARAEVEQSVREHIDEALSGMHEPVGTSELSGVLARLGPPEQWIADNEQPLLRRVAMRLAYGPEDWRLAYLSFGLTLLAFLLLPMGGMLLLIPAYLLSRAHVELVKSRGETLGARRWLVLPPIVFFAAIVVFAALFAPIAGFSAWFIERGHDLLWPGHVVAHDFAGARFIAANVAAAAGVWWIVLSGLLALLMEPLKVLFAPLMDGLRRKHVLVLLSIAAVALAIGVALLMLM